MIMKFIEATNYGQGGINWGKFAVMRFDADERDYVSVVDGHRLIGGRGWTKEHLFALDLQTGEGAMFLPGGDASSDLKRHRIWVCPLFEPFLNWLYQQDLSNLSTLPGLVKFTEEEAPSALSGYRRAGPKDSRASGPKVSMAKKMGRREMKKRSFG